MYRLFTMRSEVMAFFIYRRKRKTYTVIIYLGHLGTLRIVLYSGCQMDNWVRVSSLYSAFGTEGWAVSQLAGWCSVTAAWRPRDHCPVRGGVFCFCDSCPGHQGGQEEPEDTVSFTWLTAARSLSLLRPESKTHSQSRLMTHTSMKHK